ncbi:MAG: hypothetical protein A3I85_01640 [Candidatus Nealsonbacteria bacterium RIFCSPLOWO2_02_FULL_38_63]|nr:MAG: hypothetical protein A2981_02075 [Candidatus Nealsonbacteria bacterium RIFCSPLOWO2_01_FULL_38_120]OGZ26219.1 MAG: hypothetical protein A3I85_01640 [Candidatus Nealsonbacteria bacterium RIFCSPLOWO2_02_FULL_38_63]
MDLTFVEHRPLSLSTGLDCYLDYHSGGLTANFGIAIMKYKILPILLIIPSDDHRRGERVGEFLIYYGYN